MKREESITNIGLGQKIKVARESAGIPQAELADLLGLDYRTVSAYEKGRIRIPAITLVKFSRIVNRSIDEIIGLTPQDGRTAEGRLKKKFLELQKLDESEQAAILHVVDAMLAKHPS